jgi:TolB-like protein
MTGPEARIHYEFNGFRLDPQQRLLAASNGAPVPLPPRVLDTLLLFLERRGELLDKQTLMATIWPNVVVEENSLNQHIALIRRALGEGPREHRFIVTEPGRGYRFVADVRVVTAAGPVQPQPAQDTALRSPEQPRARRSIAVLPFANLTGDPGKDYLGDGLAEELIHTLARVPGLRVPARTSSFAYKGRNVDLRRIAAELGVDTVLEGSVRAAGERIRITAQLIDGETGYHVWSQHYDRRFEDLFELQDELAAAIILQTLSATLLGLGPKSLLRAPPTQNLEAYRLFLEGVAALPTPGQGLRAAFDKLQLALRLDPAFAPARAALVEARGLAVVFDVPLPGTLADAEHETRTALDGDRQSAATYWTLGVIRAAQGRWLEAEECFQQALALDDAEPWFWSSHSLHVLGTTGHLRAALFGSQQSLRLGPGWTGGNVATAAAHLVLGNDAEARVHAQAAFDLGYPRAAAPLVDMLSQIELRAGRCDVARALMQEAVLATMRLPRAVEATSRVFDALAGTVDRATAVAALDGLRSDVGVAGLHQFMRRRLIVWYSMLGAYDQAYEVMNSSLDDFAATGTIGITWGFLWFQELAGFREDPRFSALAVRMRLPDYWNKHGPPDGYDWRDDRLIPR